MELVNQPFTGQLGERLIALLDLPNYHTLNITVAFAKNSGVLRIKDSLETFRKRGGKVNVYVGIDLGGTSYEALTALLLHTDSLKIIHSEKSQTFHSKVYQLLGDEQSLLIVGSNNLTGGGLWTNFETSILLDTGSEAEVLKCVEEHTTKLSKLNDSCMSISNQGDIDTLLENGYILKEVTEHLRSSKALNKESSGKRLFGNGAPAKLPHLSQSKASEAGDAIAKPAASAQDAASTNLAERQISDVDGQTIWFETRKLTGGSRNIIDLSTRALIEHGNPKGTPFDLGEERVMRGGVEFFGLDPSATEQSKDIVINFDGVDYYGNRILYPTGAKANGSWRLQVKGVSSEGRKITDAFKAKGEQYYLVEKVVTFTKIQANYYFLSVIPESELGNLRAASRILARNGSTSSAKQFGLL